MDSRSFLSDRADKEKPAQIYLIPFSGGEAAAVRCVKSLGTFLVAGWAVAAIIQKLDPGSSSAKRMSRRKSRVVYRHYDRLL
jgi:hypothetical protein